MKKILQLLFVGIIGLSLNSCYYDEVIPTFEEPIVIDPNKPITFTADIAPILVKCTACHNGSQNPDMRNSQAAYNNLIANYVVKGNATSSSLYTKVASGSHYATFSANELALLKAWIESDAKY